MSTGETEKTTGYTSGDGEDWLYGDNDDDLDDDAGDDDDKKTETEIFSALTGDVEVDNQANTDSDDNLCVTIGSIKTDKIQSSSIPVNLRSLGIPNVSGTKFRGVALAALDNNIIATPALDVDEELEAKPWRKPGADLSDYFNYGFHEDTWKAYCDKQRKLRMSLQFMTLGSSDKNTASHHDLVLKSDSSSRKLKSTIDVIGGQTETIVRLEGQRHHSTDGSILQVQSSSKQPVHADPPSSKLPPFFPPIIPPPPFPPPPFNSTSSIIQQPPRPSLNMPPPGFPLPPEVPCPPFTSGRNRDRRFMRNSRQIGDCASHSGRSGGSYDGSCAPPYPFAAGVYPHPLGHITPWMGVSDRAKACKYSSYQDRKDRDRGKDGERTREQEWDRKAKNEQERARDQENTPSFQSRSSDRERASRHRDHGERERDRRREQNREEREREDHHRDRRNSDRNKRHKSSHSSSRRGHSSDEEESHRRRRYKHSKRNQDSTDTGSTD